MGWGSIKGFVTPINFPPLPIGTTIRQCCYQTKKTGEKKSLEGTNMGRNLYKSTVITPSPLLGNFIPKYPFLWFLSQWESTNKISCDLYTLDRMKAVPAKTENRLVQNP